MKLLIVIGIIIIIAGVLLMSGCKEETLNGKNVREIFKEPGVQALAVAAARGDVELVTKLVAEGADVNGTGFEGARPLVWAWGHNNLKGMEALLKAGADPDFEFSGIDFIDYTVDEKTTDYLELILKYGANPDGLGDGSGPIHYAINLRNHDAIKIIIKHGGNINGQDSFGSTPLIHCLDIRQMDFAMWLIDNGADVDVMEISGGTAAWSIQDGFISKTYNDEGTEKAKIIKQMLIDRGVKFPPLSPAENRKKYGLPEP